MLGLEETDGFVNFPPNLPNVIIERNKTLVYLVAFDWTNISGSESILSNTNIKLNAKLISDDVNGIAYINNNVSNAPTQIYFPKSRTSIPFVTSICIGWSESSYKIIQDGSTFEQDWFCTFRELTNEGRKLYYSIKKLHNNKEVRLLTFTNIKK